MKKYTGIESSGANKWEIFYFRKSYCIAIGWQQSVLCMALSLSKNYNTINIWLQSIPRLNAAYIKYVPHFEYLQTIRMYMQTRFPLNVVFFRVFLFVVSRYFCHSHFLWTSSSSMLLWNRWNCCVIAGITPFQWMDEWINEWINEETSRLKLHWGQTVFKILLVIH